MSEWDVVGEGQRHEEERLKVQQEERRHSKPKSACLCLFPLTKLEVGETGTQSSPSGHPRDFWFPLSAMALLPSLPQTASQSRLAPFTLTWTMLIAS